MAFSMPCCAKVPRLWPEVLRRPWRWLWLGVLALTLWPALVQAKPGAELAALSVERAGTDLRLSADVKVQLPTAVEDALVKGIPVYFVAEARLVRERWYWTDAVAERASRYVRLAYQPLTRRWRVNISSEPIVNTGLGVSLTQLYDSLDEALAGAARISRWKIADASQLTAGAAYRVEFSYRLDTGQLPRPFQMGALGQSDWRLGVERTVRLSEGGSE